MNSTQSYTGITNGNSQAPKHQRKRSWSGVNDTRHKFDPTRAPPLPTLQGDLILQVFTHKSLRQPDVSPELYGDNERLAGLGKSVFQMAFTCYLFKKRPMLKAEDISMQRRLLSSRGMLQDWVKHYGFMKRLMASPDVMSKLDIQEDGAAVFYAYIGALFTSSGPGAAHVWLDSLLSQEELIQPETATKAEFPVGQTPPQKRVKSETLSPAPSSSGFWRIPPAPMAASTIPTVRPAQNVPTVRPTTSHYTAQHSPPAPSASILPPRVSKSNHPNPLAPAQPQAAFLPLFNQAAAKRKVTIEYLAEFSGLKHAGNWTVKCIVNGICKGEGSSTHKQTAKEEAARNAYYSMGWQ